MMGLGIPNLHLGEEFAAQQVFYKLHTDFAEDERMATAGCLIGDEYRSLEMYDKACELYQYVINKWPGTEKAMWSQTNMGNIKLELGDENAARAIFDKVLADFAGHPVLPKAVNLMAYGYYRKALSNGKEGLDELAKWYY
jgi:TolA-binding protein